MSFLIVLFYIAVLVTVAIVIVNTSTTSKALAYLMLIFLFPVLGLIVYFAIGRNYRTNKLYSKKLEIDRKAFPELEREVGEYSNQVLTNFSQKLGNFFNLAKFIEINSVITTNNQLKLLVNGEEKFPELITDLKNAKHFIHIEYYIYESDDIGIQIAEILKQKAREGVEVRFIYDDFGSKSIRKSFVANLVKSGVEAYPFYKVKLLLLANRINYRNHRKIVVIDGHVGYVGGINVSDKYINLSKNKRYWRDTHLKITGAAVLSLQRVFMADWNFCAKQNIGVTQKYFPLERAFDNKTGQLAQIVYSGPDSDCPNIMYAMIQAVLLSKKEILITTPYFIPDASFMNALKIASLSNVDVKILVPDKSDNVFVNATSNSYYQELLEVGIGVYRYQKGFVHAKTMVCDGFVSTIGTTNLDHRSFDLNFEVNAFVYNETLSENLRQNFYNDLKHAKKIDLAAWKKRPLLIRFSERVVRLMSPLM
ncbi:MAG: cardiolipin synthase [Flavobacteriaceae bacterium]